MWLIVVDTWLWTCVILNLQLLSPKYHLLRTLLSSFSTRTYVTYICIPVLYSPNLVCLLAWPFFTWVHTVVCSEVSAVVVYPCSLTIFSGKNQWAYRHSYSLVHTWLLNTLGRGGRSIWVWPCRNVTGCGLELGLCCYSIACQYVLGLVLTISMW